MTPVGKTEPRPGFADETQMKDQRTFVAGRKDKKEAKKALKNDEKAEKRAQNAIFSKKEGASVAAGAAALGAGIATTIAVLLKKKK